MRWQAKLTLAALLFLTLRLPNLPTTPAWDWDEGVNLNVSWNLSLGRTVMFSMRYPFVPHPPLYFLLGGLLTGIFGLSLTILRSFSVLLGLCSLFLLFFVGRRVGGERLGMLSALLFSVYPGSVYWGRMAYANHLLSLINLLTLYLVVAHLQGRRISPYLIGFVSGVGVLAEYSGLLTGIAVAIIFLFYERRSAVKFAVAAAIPLILFSVIMFWFMPHEFSYSILSSARRFNFLDFRVFAALVFAVILFYILGKVKNILSTLESVFASDLSILSGGRHINPMLLTLFSLNIAVSFSILSSFSGGLVKVGLDYFWFGIMGFFYLPKRWREVVLFFAMPFVALLLVIDRGDHMLIPLHPYFSLGVGALLLSLHDFVRGLLPSKSWAVACSVLVYLPITFSFIADSSALLSPSVLLPEPIADNNAVLEYLNNHTREGDLVLSEPKIIQDLNRTTATVLDGIAYEGCEALYYPKDFPKSFFLQNVSYRRAKYVAASGATFSYLIENDETVDSKAVAEMLSWPVEYSAGDMIILRNPQVN